MSKIKSLFFSCSESEKCCDKAQYDEASLMEKMKIHIHIFFCQPCREYTRKNNKLSELVKQANLKACTEKQKQAWKEKIEKEKPSN